MLLMKRIETIQELVVELQENMEGGTDKEIARAPLLGAVENHLLGIRDDIRERLI